MNNLESLQFFIPELFLTAGLLVTIIVELLLKKEQKVFTAYLAATVLLITIFFLIRQYAIEPAALFGGMVVIDPMAVFFKILTAVSTLIIIFFSIPSFRVKAEYYVLLLATTLGMMLMAQVNDLLMIILAMELVGLVSYVLAGYRRSDPKSGEASLKYILFGAASTGIMAFGFSYIYGLTGQTNLFEIQQALQSTQHNPVILFVAFVLIIAGLGYKIAMVPFHFWLPDVYEGAPTPVTAFFSVGPKAAGMAVLIRFIISIVAGVSADGQTFTANAPIHAQELLAVLAVLTMTLGNLSALQQKNIKRMMAYSSIAHAGYMLMALAVFTSQSVEAVMFYLVVYMFMNFGAFWVIHRMTPHLGSEEITAYTGLGYRAPLVAVAMGVFMFSLTGLPPLAGFIGKFYLFAAVIKAEWYILAVLGVLNSVVSLYYYAYVTKVMFLNRGDDESAVSISSYDTALLLVFLIPTLVLGVYWVPVISWATQSLHFFLG